MSDASAPQMVGPCRCHSVHSKAERMQLIRDLLGSPKINIILTKQGCIFSSSHLCVGVCVWLYACRSEGVFLRQDRLAPRRAVPQISEVWPHPSCNWIDWIQIQNTSG